LAGEDVDGAAAGLTMIDPKLILRDAYGGWAAADTTGNSGVASNDRIVFKATYTGTYFLDVQDASWAWDHVLSYQLIANANPVAGSLTVGVAKTGTVDFKGDIDQYSVTLTGGVKYHFELDGAGLANPFLELADNNFDVAMRDDDSAGNLDAGFDYTPTTSGTYYVGARSSGNQGTGAYTLTVSTGQTQAKTALQLFNAAGDGSTEAGMVRTLADFSKAAYSKQTWEPATYNNIDTVADGVVTMLEQEGWSPVLLSVSGFSTDSAYKSQMVDGFYANENAAAFVARCGDALVVAFRGTNDFGKIPAPDVGDDTEAGHFDSYYDLMRPLIAAVEKYVDDPANGIQHIYLTGHSLGGAMVTKFMQVHSSSAYSAVTFAAPFVFGSPDTRELMVAVDGDAIAADMAFNGPTVNVSTGISSLNPLTFHSMDLYRQIAVGIDGEGWDTAAADALMHSSIEVRVPAAYQNGTYYIDGQTGDPPVGTATNDVMTDPALVDFGIYYGGSGNDTLTGGSAAETFLGGAGNDSISGGGGMDTMSGGAGNDTLVGGAGLQVADYDGAHDHFTISGNADTGIFTVTDDTGTDGSDVLQKVERLQFDDAWVALDLNGSAGEAYRLYQAAFDRTPDLGGLGYWIGTMDRGIGLTQVAAAFIGSAEFQQTYGSLSDTQFVIRLYANVLHRAPDAGGLQFHIDVLANGATRAEVLAEFSESLENKSNVMGSIEHGIAYWL
jgi:hypothetical protein